jgi:peptidoglycan-associated lipoprotein
MSTIHRYRLAAVVSALSFSLVLTLGCRSTPPAPTASPPAKPVAVAEASDFDSSLSNRLETREVLPKLEPVYFGTDDATLPIEARKLLEGYAKSVLDHPEWGAVTIDGHCDERGSDAYNQALGRRRAAAVGRYLAAMDVPPERLVIRSFGADMPAARGHDESAWSYNRRSELSVELRTAARR